MDRFLVTAAETVVDAIDLAPLKVVAMRDVAPPQRTDVTYGDFGRLVGYAVSPAAGALQPGAALTVTVYYRGGKEQGRRPIRTTRQRRSGG